MKDKLIYFLAKYGNDFFHKLPKYKTAEYKGEIIGLSYFSPERLTFLATKGNLSFSVDLFDLDNFVL